MYRGNLHRPFALRTAQKLAILHGVVYQEVPISDDETSARGTDTKITEMLFQKGKLGLGVRCPCQTVLSFTRKMTPLAGAVRSSKHPICPAGMMLTNLDRHLLASSSFHTDLLC